MKRDADVPTELKQTRLEMDAINAQLAQLLVRRFQLALKIGELKRAFNSAAHDLTREEQMLANVQKIVDSSGFAEQVGEVFSKILSVSLKLIGGTREKSKD